jgi:NADPH2:quinone reductase
MQAAYIDQLGPPENIRYGELPLPVVRERDVLVKVAAVTVNPIDTYIRSGAYKTPLPLPFIVGRDLTGVVAEIGPEVTRFTPGDRVWANNQGYDGRQGTFAEYVSVDERLLYPLPPGVDLHETVAVLHSALTAVIGLFAKARVQEGETIFVNGGSGNVGTAVLQLAKASGARVIVTAGNEEKIRWCQELGADLVINYKTQDVEQAIRGFASMGVDIYWDATKAPEVERALSVIARRGRLIVMAGLTHRCTLPVGPFYTSNCTLYGFTVTDATVEELGDYAAQINSWLAKGALRAKIAATLPLSKAAEAHRMFETNDLFGKLVLLPEL